MGYSNEPHLDNEGPGSHLYVTSSWRNLILLACPGILISFCIFLTQELRLDFRWKCIHELSDERHFFTPIKSGVWFFLLNSSANFHLIACECGSGSIFMCLLISSQLRVSKKGLTMLCLAFIFVGLFEISLSTQRMREKKVLFGQGSPGWRWWWWWWSVRPGIMFIG